MSFTAARKDRRHATAFPIASPDGHRWRSVDGPTKVDVAVLRNGKERTFVVTLGELSEQRTEAEEEGESGANWGLTVANLTPETLRRLQLDRKQKGVVITDVDFGSPADIAGLQPGDVVEEVNRQSIKSVNDFTKALRDAKGGDTVLLLVRRGEATAFFALRKSS